MIKDRRLEECFTCKDGSGLICEALAILEGRGYENPLHLELMETNDARVILAELQF
jgi:hypothetical protein